MAAALPVIAVIPALNEAASIGPVVTNTLAHADRVIVVDDGSSDLTATVANDAGADVVRLDANRGYDGAIDAGFAEADRLGAGIIVTLDADGQLDPADIARFKNPIIDGMTDLVIGIRPRTQRVSESLFGLYGRVRFGVPDLLCGMKAYHIDLYRRHGRFDGVKSIGTELTMVSVLTGARPLSVPIGMAERTAGQPRFGSGFRANWRILKALFWAIRADCGFGYPPRKNENPVLSSEVTP